VTRDPPNMLTINSNTNLKYMDEKVRYAHAHTQLSNNKWPGIRRDSGLYVNVPPYWNG